VQIRLTGQIVRVNYYDAASGFTVALLETEAAGEGVTVVGPLYNPQPGEVLHVEGHWETHAVFGRQLRVERFRSGHPHSIEGIRRYLGSGLIKGIGAEMAKRIVAHFGEATLAIIAQDGARLQEVPGIGPQRAAQIQEAWSAQREVRDVMLFLQEHAIATTHALKIFQAYGPQTLAVLRRNPYRLAGEIAGIGFKTADRIARRLGFALDSPARAEAGVLYRMLELSEKGHVYFPREALETDAAQLLGIDRRKVTAAVAGLGRTGRLVITLRPGAARPGPQGGEAVYLAALYRSETDVARHLLRLHQARAAPLPLQMAEALALAARRLGLQPAAAQQAAIRAALHSKILVITGGPGTGKTTLIRAIIAIYEAGGARMHLAAPTGRAAKRMAESAGRQAQTIHRLLEFSFPQGGFQRDAQHPLQSDLVIVDEASMLDIRLMDALVQALPDAARLILVGDIDQLPSVGPGAVLGDVIGAGCFAVVRLTDIFRQARASTITVNAHRINAGKLPQLKNDAEAGDFFFIERNTPEQALDTIVHLVAARIPQRFGFDARRDIQVLTPMHRGVTGVANLNRILQTTLNPQTHQMARGQHLFQRHDKVMQVRNNYDKDVYNGDIGTISAIAADGQGLTVAFDGREVPYAGAEVDEIELAYAISIHKSQGSEFPAVVVPVLTQHYVLLQRNLLYTAVTRGRRLVVLVGARKALAMAVRNAVPQARYSGLGARLQACAPCIGVDSTQ